MSSRLQGLNDQFGTMRQKKKATLHKHLIPVDFLNKGDLGA